MEPGLLKIARCMPLPASLAIGAIIRDRREALNLSLGELQERCGVTRQMLSFTEKNRRGLGLDSFNRIGLALDIQPSLLLHAAEQEVLHWPRCAATRNYCCVVDGRPSCCNPARSCPFSSR